MHGAEGSHGGEVGHGGFAGMPGHGESDFDHGDSGAGHGGHGHGGHGHGHGHNEHTGLTYAMNHGHGFVHAYDFSAELSHGLGGHGHGFGGHGHGHGHGHELAHRDCTAHYVALAVLAEYGGHGHHGSLAWHAHGNLANVPAYTAHAHHCHERLSQQQIQLPGIGRNDTTIELLHFPHRQLDVSGYIAQSVRHVQTGRGLLRRLRLSGLSELVKPPVLNAPKPLTRHDSSILSLAPFSDKPLSGPKPLGWYPGVQGTTELWRRLWQVKPSFLCPRSDSWQTFLVEFGYTANYDGLSETRVAFSVWSTGYTMRGDWVFDWEAIRMHRECAEQLVQRLKRHLDANPAAASAVRKHAELQANALCPSTTTTEQEVRDLSGRPVGTPATPVVPESTGGGVVPLAGKLKFNKD